MKLTIDLPYEIIDQISEIINWDKLVRDNPRLSLEFIERYVSYINFDILFSMKPLNYNLISIYKDKINGKVISQRNDITLEILKYISDIPDLDWKLLTQNYFNYEFIEMFQDKPLDWNFITREYDLLYIPSRIFIRKDWGSRENFLSIFKKCINWSLIIYEQLTDDFISEHSEYVDWDTYIINEFADENLIINNIDRIDLNLVAKYQYISFEFIKKYADNIRSDLLLSNTYIEEIHEEIILLYKQKLNKVYIHTKSTETICTICMESMSQCCKIICNHEFHDSCISEWLLRNEVKSCPLCRHQL